MDYSEVKSALSKLRTHAGEERRFAAERQAEAQEAAVVLTGHWLGQKAPLSERAAQLLDQMAELSLRPLLSVAAAQGSPLRIRGEALRKAVRAELGLRTALLSHLEALLSDRRPIPMSEACAALDAPPPPRRVCDEACVLIRRLVHAEEEGLEAAMDSGEFMAMPDPLKDAAIARARQTHNWQALARDMRATGVEV